MKVKPVVNSLLKRAASRNIEITPLQAQKLLYFLNGRYLSLYGDSIIDEPFYVWRFGPVVPSLYSELKKYGAKPISSYLRESDGTVKVVSESKTQFWNALDATLDKYGSMTGTALSALSHEKGSPWDKTDIDQPIGNDLIKKWFLEENLAGASNE